MATKFCEISTLLLSYVWPVKSKVEDSQNFVAFSEYMNFTNYLFECITAEASKLTRYNKRSTINSWEVQTTIRLLHPGELAKHTISEGTKAEAMSFMNSWTNNLFECNCCRDFQVGPLKQEVHHHLLKDPNLCQAPPL